jgi:Protein of unknown function (DUF3485)
MRRSLKLALTVLAACAALKLAVVRPPPAAATGAAPFVKLPAALGTGVPGRPLALSPVEQRLAAAPHVTIERRRYGSTDVSLVSVAGGIREHHPPTVCLDASGFEVVERTEQTPPSGRCVVELRIRHRDGGPIQLFTYTYLSDRGQITCSLGRRVGGAIWDRLTGDQTRWATVQVLDAKPRRARRALRFLIRDHQQKRDPL